MKDREDIEVALSQLEADEPNLHGVESGLRSVVASIIQREGYSEMPPSPKEPHVNLVAYQRDTDSDSWYTSLAITIKSVPYGGVINVAEVQQLIAATFEEHDRALFVTNGAFSAASLQFVEQNPFRYQLIGIPELRNWADTAFGCLRPDVTRISRAIRKLSRELAKVVAKRPSALLQIEWRDLERLLAEVFEGLGFRVELTRPAKDGGKDIVLGCTVRDREIIYLVEVKHWVSGRKVGQNPIKEFIRVIAREHADNGLFLSTSGYARSTLEGLTLIEREMVRLGSANKIVSLCQTYVRVDAGVWSPPSNLPELIFSGTEN